MRAYYGAVEPVGSRYASKLLADLTPLIVSHEGNARTYYMQARGEGPTFDEISPSDIIPGWFANMQNRTIGSKDWVGNWCWNSYHFTYREYRRLIRALAKHGWRCTGGLARWTDAFDRLAASKGSGRT